MARILAAVLSLVCFAASSSAVQMTLDDRAIGEAILAGQSRIDRERARIHQTYRLVVRQPPVDWVDVITPFHRVMLAAEAQARAGNRMFAQREALVAQREAPGPITLMIELTFHPLNTFIGVPAYNVSLAGPRDTQIQPLRIDRYPRFQARTESPAPELAGSNAAPVLGKGQPVLGGTIVVPFSSAELDPVGSYTVVISEAGKELARVPVDFGKLR
jgi:hypothetical protein